MDAARMLGSTYVKPWKISAWSAHLHGEAGGESSAAWNIRHDYYIFIDAKKGSPAELLKGTWGGNSVWASAR